MIYGLNHSSGHSLFRNNKEYSSQVCNFGFSCSHVRAVVSTLGGPQGAAASVDKWQHLYAGFTVWLSQTEATGTFFFFNCFTLYE